MAGIIRRHGQQDAISCVRAIPFRASLANPISPGASATAIRHVIESGTWQLRHMPGPNAAPFVGWKASMTDEQWVDWNALSDGAWYDAVQRDFGLDARRS
jgi:hypothetical protein